MAIHPLPQFEADIESLRVERNAEQLREAGASQDEIDRLSDDDRAVYKRLKTPKSLVVRFGVMKLVGEFPYDGATKPGCGSKLVVRTHRGVEVGEMLTSTCPNAGCSKSVTRKEMLEYIENSGGRQYPFRTDGKVLRIATAEDLDAQAKVEQSRHGLKMQARALAERLLPQAKIVDAEPLLGGERMTVYYTSDDRLETRELHAALQSEFKVRVDLRHVGARDEARITADYERCGQYCCCKNFLKVLKPVSMRSAKVQKGSLDPLKISGRCGRLMCCLRYEDETYEDLRRRLPNRKARIGTPDGDGVVLDTQILTQLALVKLDATGEQVAVPVEEITKPGEQPEPARKDDKDKGNAAGNAEHKQPPPKASKPRPAHANQADDKADAADTADTADPTDTSQRKKRRRRRQRSGQGSSAGEHDRSPTDPAQDPAQRSTQDQDQGPKQRSDQNTDQHAGSTEGPSPQRKKRRRKRRPKPPEQGGGAQGGDAPGGGDGPAA